MTPARPAAQSSMLSRAFEWSTRPAPPRGHRQRLHTLHTCRGPSPRACRPALTAPRSDTTSSDLPRAEHSDTQSRTSSAALARLASGSSSAVAVCRPDLSPPHGTASGETRGTPAAKEHQSGCRWKECGQAWSRQKQRRWLIVTTMPVLSHHTTAHPMPGTLWTTAGFTPVVRPAAFSASRTKSSSELRRPPVPQSVTTCRPH